MRIPSITPHRALQQAVRALCGLSNRTERLAVRSREVGVGERDDVEEKGGERTR